MAQRVFVGDVQGCADELDSLIARARAELGPDFELHFTGDLVNRGPASFRVLQRVRALQDAGRARTVIGNHDAWLATVALGSLHFVSLMGALMLSAAYTVAWSM